MGREEKRDGDTNRLNEMCFRCISDLVSYRLII